jgi:2-dehydro-3-deoxygalactonokinase
MTTGIWIGIEATPDQATGWRFDGVTAQQQASAPTAAEVMQALGPAPALIVDDSAPAHPVPAKALPEAAPMRGLRQDRPHGYLDAAARLRIAGALAGHPNWDGTICLPLTSVTHWCQISAGEVVSFQSALTPALARGLGATEQIDMAALADTLSRPEKLALHLRSATLMQAGDAVAGHLVGAELAAMRPYWLGQQVLVIGGGDLYPTALTAQGVPVTRRDPVEMAQAGLVALRKVAAEGA